MIILCLCKNIHSILVPGTKDTMVNRTDMAPHEAYKNGIVLLYIPECWFIMSVDWAIQLGKFEDADFIFGEKVYPVYLGV